MDTRLNNSAPYPTPAPVRIDAAPVREAVRTDLNPPAAVAAQSGAEMVRSTRGQRQHAGSLPQHESSIDTDRETGDLVYRIIDPETRTTIAQYPYESILKLRAYIRSTESVDK